MTVRTLDTSKAFSPDVTMLDAGETIPDALVLNITSVVGSIQGDEPAVRVGRVVTDPEANTVAEGALIPESDPETADTVVKTRKIATLHTVSREQMKQAGAPGLFAHANQRSLIRKANRTLIQGDADANTGDSLWDAGIRAAITGPAYEFGTNLDAANDAVWDIEDAGFETDFVVASPKAMKDLTNLKVADGSNQTLLNAGVDAAERRLVGVRVFVTNALPDYEVLMGSRMGISSAVSAVELSTSEHGDAFKRDARTIRTVFRFGFSAPLEGSVALLKTPSHPDLAA